MRGRQRQSPGFAGLANQGSDIAMGRATHVSDDDDGNPVYDVEARSIFRTTNAVKQEDVIPFRFYAGVKVSPASSSPVRCMGVRDPVLGWMWVVEELIDWGDCP